MKSKYLFSTIAAFAALTTLSANHAIPQPAYGEIDPAEVADFAAKDTNRLRGNVVKAITRRSPWVNVLEGGTLESGMSDVQRVSIQERAVLNQSLIRPTFTLDTQSCGATGEAAELGETEYSFSLSTLSGKGPLVCIKTMWSSFKTAFSAAEETLKKEIMQLMNSDVRITLVDRSGCKMVLRVGQSFSTMFDGNVSAIDTPFPNIGLPNAAPNMKTLDYLGQFMREDFMVDPFDVEGTDGVLKVIGSQEIITVLRDEANVREDHRYIAAGSFGKGEKALTRYSWAGPYRGFAFGIDSQALRFNSVNAQGQPIYLEPEYGAPATKGSAARIRPEWARAKFEVLVVMGQGSFKRLTPEMRNAEGTWKFPAQSATGQLIWRNTIDNDQNVWGDYGRHYYRITRAYEPLKPHAVCAIAFARNRVNFGLTEISDFGDYASTASL